MWLFEDETIISETNTLADAEELVAQDASETLAPKSEPEATTEVSRPESEIETGFSASESVASVNQLANLDSLDRIVEFQANTFLFSGGVAAEFAIVESLDYANAFSEASSLLAGDEANFVAVQLGNDVILFADVGEVDSIGAAVVMVGRSLADLGLGSF
jgi:hypothetical protein